MQTGDPISFFRPLFRKYSSAKELPYRWQETIFEEFVDGRVRPELSVPTGMGKTSVITIWLLALAWQTINKLPRTVPIRLVWVVDRRAVVDQATTEAEELAESLTRAPTDDEVRCAISQLWVRPPEKEVLAISTLRGERADNRLWSGDPCGPAIVIGTVDMVGSRLLFSGYGDSMRTRAHHAALLGQDSLIVNDEAHLTPVFADLLKQVSAMTGGERPMQFMRLSATPRNIQQPCSDFMADLANPEFKKRFQAVKRLNLIESSEPKKEIEKLAAQPHGKTITFVRSPADAQKIANVISAGNDGAEVTLLTGTQRTHERDQLFERISAKPFQTGAAVETPCWLVATSAGEVGVNLTCNRLVTDLDTADHLLQRFGRMNRFGETQGEAYVVYSSKQMMGDKDEATRLRATLDYLRTLAADLSPESLQQHPPPSEALSETPKRGPLLPWLIDVWSMTSLSSKDWPSRPTVDHWLRGAEEGSPPETYVIWREDTDDLASEAVSDADRDEVFDCYRPLAQERLKANADQLYQELEQSAYHKRAALLIANDSSIYKGTLGELLDQQRERFPYATLVLPPGVGFLDKNGMVDWSRHTGQLSDDDLRKYDVSVTSERCRLRGDQLAPEGYKLVCRVEISDEESDDPKPRVWQYFKKIAVRKRGNSPTGLKEHIEDVVRLSDQLVKRLCLDKNISEAFQVAARWHDSGKKRRCWQNAACNANWAKPVAKAVGTFNQRLLGGYRHEIGSLIDATPQLPAEFTQFQIDLTLHLIAAHHGWGRPHFTEKTFDKESVNRSKKAAIASAQRFGRLQAKLGPWVLAYLETVFRCADWIASEGLEQNVNA
jgi:CRISPR-associated endonuclease/helicase Cas3